MTKLIPLAFLLVFSGCVSTNELQLSENVWRLQSSGQGLLAQGRTGDALFKRAAELTLRQGYTHFTIGNPNTASSTTTGGFTPVQANVVGNSVFVTGGQPINVNREDTSALVFMSRDPENGGIDAQEALTRLSAE